VSAERPDAPRGWRLDRRTILDAALAVADEQGIERLTIRAIAERLEASPMSLYRHFEGKQELLEGLVGVAFGILDDEADSSGAWDEELRRMFSRMHRTLLDHPALLDLLRAPSASSAQLYDTYERMLALLRAAGFSLEAAGDAIVMLESYTFGFAVQQRVRASRGPHEFGARLSQLNPVNYPNLAELGSRTPAWTTDDAFAVGLQRAIEHLRRDLDDAQHPP
jgi:AcrR family transcriptional regulator